MAIFEREKPNKINSIQFLCIFELNSSFTRPVASGIEQGKRVKSLEKWVLESGRGRGGTRTKFPHPRLLTSNYTGLVSLRLTFFLSLFFALTWKSIRVL